MAWVHKHAQPGASTAQVIDDSTLSHYQSSMLFWSEQIYRQRGIEPPNRGRLDWALTQTTKLLESRGQQHDEQ